MLKKEVTSKKAKETSNTVIDYIDAFIKDVDTLFEENEANLKRIQKEIRNPSFLL